MVYRRLKTVGNIFSLLGAYFTAWFYRNDYFNVSRHQGSFSDLSAIPFLLTTGFSSIVMIAFAYALLFKTELIADKLNVSGVPQPSARRGDNLQHGITLIGINYFALTDLWIQIHCGISGKRKTN